MLEDGYGWHIEEQVLDMPETTKLNDVSTPDNDENITRTMMEFKNNIGKHLKVNVWLRNIGWNSWVLEFCCEDMNSSEYDEFMKCLLEKVKILKGYGLTNRELVIENRTYELSDGTKAKYYESELELPR